MDQIRIGSFLKELRKEKALTQEQLAEHFGVSGRTVSRWENGNNMPDISILVEIADFYDVDIRELIDGERKSETMNGEMKDTLVKVADYSETTNKKKTVRIVVLMSLVCAVMLLSLIVVLTSREVAILPDRYPAYERVYIDKKTTDGLLKDHILSEVLAPEYYVVDSENAANFCSVSVFSSEKAAENRYYVYAWVNECIYSYDGGVLNEDAGGSYPCRFELVKENDSLRVISSESPGCGAQYNEDIEKLFPRYVRDKIYSVHDDGTVENLIAENLKQAKLYFNVG